MSILKLQLGKQNAISGTVATVSLDEGGRFGPQYKIDFTDGNCLYINKDPFERQAQRLNLLPNEFDGQVVTFWKKPMDNDPTGTKGFVNIDLGDTAPAGGSAMRNQVRDDDYVGRDLRAAGVPIKATSREELVEKYIESLADAVKVANEYELFTNGEKALGEQQVVAVAATLYIERNKRGV